MIPAGSSMASRRIALALACAAILLRALIPAGFMPGRSDTGAIAMVVCTGSGALTMVMDRDGHWSPAKPDHAPGKSQPDHPCAFAAAAAALTQPAGILEPLPAPVAENTALALPAHQRPGLGLAAPPPPTTGPPSAA